MLKERGIDAARRPQNRRGEGASCGLANGTIRQRGEERTFSQERPAVGVMIVNNHQTFVEVLALEKVLNVSQQIRCRQEYIASFEIGPERIDVEGRVVMKHKLVLPFQCFCDIRVDAPDGPLCVGKDADDLHSCRIVIAHSLDRRPSKLGFPFLCHLSTNNLRGCCEYRCRILVDIQAEFLDHTSVLFSEDGPNIRQDDTLRFQSYCTDPVIL